MNIPESERNKLQKLIRKMKDKSKVLMWRAKRGKASSQLLVSKVSLQKWVQGKIKIGNRILRNCSIAYKKSQETCNLKMQSLVLRRAI